MSFMTGHNFYCSAKTNLAKFVIYINMQLVSMIWYTHIYYEQEGALNPGINTSVRK